MTINATVTSVLVFKTNLSPRDVDKIDPVLSADQRIRKWTVDVEDVDRVLRVETDHLTALEVQLKINAAGYFCEELPD